MMTAPTPVRSNHSRQAAQRIERWLANPDNNAQRDAMARLAQDAPLWIRRHGLAITGTALKALAADTRSEQQLAAKELLAAMQAGLDPLNPIELPPPDCDVRDMAVLTAVVRERLDAFALAAKVLIAKSQP